MDLRGLIYQNESFCCDVNWLNWTQVGIAFISSVFAFKNVLIFARVCVRHEVGGFFFSWDIIIQGKSEEKSSQQNHVRKWLSNLTHGALVEFPPLGLQFIWQTLQKMYKQTCITLTLTLKQVDVHIIRQKRRPPEWRDTRTATDSDSGLGGISTPCSGARFRMTDRLCYIIWRV